MANTNAILEVVLANEGGYNCAFTGSGETYRGIDRNYSKAWQGWAYIDAAKRSGRIDSRCGKNEQNYFTPTLNALVIQWYNTKFLAAGNLAKIQNQTLATFVADFWWHKPYRAVDIANTVALRIQKEHAEDFYYLGLTVQTNNNKISDSVIDVMNLYPDVFYKYFRALRIQYYNNPQSINKGYTERFTTSLRGLLIRVYNFPAFIIDLSSLTNLFY